VVNGLQSRSVLKTGILQGGPKSDTPFWYLSFLCWYLHEFYMQFLFTLRPLMQTNSVFMRINCNSSQRLDQLN